MPGLCSSFDVGVEGKAVKSLRQGHTPAVNLKSPRHRCRTRCVAGSSQTAAAAAVGRRKRPCVANRSDERPKWRAAGLFRGTRTQTPFKAAGRWMGGAARSRKKRRGVAPTTAVPEALRRAQGATKGSRATRAGSWGPARGERGATGPPRERPQGRPLDAARGQNQPPLKI